MAAEAEIIFISTRAGIGWGDAWEMEPWQLASAIGIHRVETREDHDAREIVEWHKAYYEETGEARAAHMEGYSERRKASKAARRQRQREETRANG